MGKTWRHGSDEERERPPQESKKPTNRVFCLDCGRPKLLFKTEEKANRFIKRCGPNINTYGGELRAYWCPTCLGYHTTHVDYDEKYDKRSRERERVSKRILELKRLSGEKFRNAVKLQELEEVINKYLSMIPENYINEGRISDVKQFISEKIRPLEGEENLAIQELRKRAYEMTMKNYKPSFKTYLEELESLNQKQ